MLVTLHGDVKERHSDKEGYYILQTDLVNEKPCWFQEDGGNAVWGKNGHTTKWYIGPKEDLGEDMAGISSPDDVENPHQALTWKYWN